MKNRTDFVSVGVKEQLVQAVRNQWEAARAVLWALLGLVVGLGNMMLEISPFGAAENKQPVRTMKDRVISARTASSACTFDNP